MIMNDFLKKYLTKSPLKCQDHEKQGKTKKLSQTGVDYLEIIIEYHVVSWIVSLKRKKNDHNRKTAEIRKIRSFITSIILILIYTFD